MKYREDEKETVEGPLVVEDLQKQFSEGQIHSNTLISNGIEIRDWRPLQTWNSLFLQVLSTKPAGIKKNFCQNFLS